MKRVIFWAIVVTALIIVALFSSMSHSIEGYTNGYKFNGSTQDSGIETHTYSTNSDMDGGGNSIYLDRQGLECPDGQALSGFHLSRDGERHFHIDYKCKSIVMNPAMIMSQIPKS